MIHPLQNEPCLTCKTDRTDSSTLNLSCNCEFLHDSEDEKFFAKTNTFIDTETYEKILFTIKQLEKIFRSAAFRARVNPLSKNGSNGGVLMSYDFHLTDKNPKLIEVNVNAGGIFLAQKLAQSSKCCCSDKFPTNLGDFEAKIIAMFKKEYTTKSKKSEKHLSTVLILDENPEKQFLYPDFQLCKALLEKHSIKTVIADPKDVFIKEGKVTCYDTEIDLIYNRLTDFYFEMPQNHHLKQIFDLQLAVISPSPLDHKIYAHKESLTLLQDKGFISQLISHDDFEKLTPFLLNSFMLKAENSGNVWKNRKEYFLKPVDSYGSKGAYRGANITHKIWETIQENPYIAQEYAPANKRNVNKDNYKYDLRAYTYEGDVLLLTARLYQGQTTNFRTTGGGFSTVLLI